MFTLDLDGFIGNHVTGRSASLFESDILANSGLLQDALDGRSALIIGGAGSIGSSFIKAMLRFNLSRLYVVDTNENGLTELTRDLRSSTAIHIPNEFRTYPVNFGDSVFSRILYREGPFDIVANFAAHKHVRSEKDHYSIAAMLKNNVLRNHALLEQLSESPPQHFFCVSTDKAANPVNIMGASKKLMEELLLAYSDTLPIVTARFANVAFSQGSLLDGFLYRLQKRQPLSAPSDVRRYFVSPQESGQLCLLACILGRPGDIFFPKLAQDQMRTFSSIAEKLLSAVGREPDLCESEEEARQKMTRYTPENTAWPVYFFKSDTSGEKPFEEFFSSSEKPELSRFDAIGVIRAEATVSRTRVNETMAELSTLLERPEANKATIVAFMANAVPTFRHIETGKSLDERM